jgi:O-antigen ligase
VLSAYVVLLIAVPPRLVLGPLGGAGAPATVIALGCLGWWVFDRCTRSVTDRFGQPVRAALFLLLMAFTASYVVAMLRAIDGDEYSIAQLGMVLLLGWAGVVLVANDGILTLDHLVTVVRRIVMMTAAMACLGAVQFVTGQQLVDRVSVPGMSLNGSSIALISREGFSRPAGTALHPIEYGSIITMVMPLAISLAMHDTSRHALRRWFPVAVIALAVPLSLSRSAILASLVGLGVMGLAWTASQRRKAVAAAAALFLTLFMTVPGMLGSLAALFTGISGDTSTQSRTGSYAIAAEYVQRSPLLGRGFSTFLPSYRILDNELLLLLIEVGVLGLVAFLALVLTAVTCAFRSRSRATDPLLSQLAHALGASLLAALCTMAFFDGLGFPMTAGMLFLLLGLAGALWRLVREQAAAEAATARSALAAVKP